MMHILLLVAIPAAIVAGYDFMYQHGIRSGMKRAQAQGKVERVSQDASRVDRSALDKAVGETPITKIGYIAPPTYRGTGVEAPEFQPTVAPSGTRES